jgi:FAD/FMN-containing dehydrogenase
VAAWREEPGAFSSARDNEVANVRRWNVERLIYDIGVDVDAAILTAEAGVDWHDVDDLVRRGCPVDRALEIVA